MLWAINHQTRSLMKLAQKGDHRADIFWLRTRETPSPLSVRMNREQGPLRTANSGEVQHLRHPDRVSIAEITAVGGSQCPGKTVLSYNLNGIGTVFALTAAGKTSSIVCFRRCSLLLSRIRSSPVLTCVATINTVSQLIYHGHIFVYH